jgi:hypothetical protein
MKEAYDPQNHYEELYRQRVAEIKAKLRKDTLAELKSCCRKGVS